MPRVSGQCLLDEKTVLLQIRSEITYSSASTKLLLWDERVDCCRWPNFFQGFKNLTVLSLADQDGNKLSGHINELQNVTSPLALLDLSNNNLEGTIPSFFFQFQNLSTLFLGMSQIPSFFFQLQNLTFLYLSSNKFSGQMIDLQNVTSPLEVVDLSMQQQLGRDNTFILLSITES
ncbi:receptor-like protein 53 [Ipomoea triloba]|uniref:receptor-like protein 53 n=1 Tax=Ipomoea triloba TaxID=35885 RepID=UPI00125DC8E5|nr:receptor-like protein 53 [Ipomoea triloba]XP_031098298.1 receptor-like protein 53 [Ipomoea triloba]